MKRSQHGGNRGENNSPLFWGVRKTNYTNPALTLPVTYLQFYSGLKFCVHFLYLVTFKMLGRLPSGEKLMWGEVSSVIYSSVLWVWEEHWRSELIHQTPNDLHSGTANHFGYVPSSHSLRDTFSFRFNYQSICFEFRVQIEKQRCHCWAGWP